MKEQKLATMSLDFSVDVLKSVENIKGHSSLVNQLERSSTSIGANIHESHYAHSKADFVAKLEIALKECYETEYWLELFSRAGILSSEKIESLRKQCGSIRRILIASITTTKEKP